MALSIRDMARALGVSKSQVSRDKLAGMPMTDADSARAWRRVQHDMSRTVEGRIDRPGSAADDAPAAAVLSIPPADEAPDTSDAQLPAVGDTEEYRRHRTERERLRKEREQFELDRDRGNSIALVDAQRLVFTGFRTLRDRAAFIPDRIVGLSEEQRAMLENELAAVFNLDPAQLLADTDEEDDDDAPV